VRDRGQSVRSTRARPDSTRCRSPGDLWRPRVSEQNMPCADPTTQ